uniref:V-type proton ATPase proteolipid subunit n=1 Tax=Rhizophora mucronata TaxID=61149 RepID=A0A2P2ISH9_RHIMU
MKRHRSLDSWAPPLRSSFPVTSCLIIDMSSLTRFILEFTSFELGFCTCELFNAFVCPRNAL